MLPENDVLRDVLGDEDVGVVVAQVDLSSFQRISVVLTSAASRKAEEAAVLGSGNARVEIESRAQELAGLSLGHTRACPTGIHECKEGGKEVGWLS